MRPRVEEAERLRSERLFLGDLAQLCFGIRCPVADKGKKIVRYSCHFCGNESFRFRVEIKLPERVHLLPPTPAAQKKARGLAQVVQFFLLCWQADAAKLIE